MENMNQYMILIPILVLLILVIIISSLLKIKKTKTTHTKSVTNLQLEPVAINVEEFSNSLIDNIKQVLFQRYNVKIEEYNKLKEKVEQIENEIVADNSKDVYEENLRNLKKMKLKKNSPEYKEQLDQIETDYKNSLLKFEENYNNYMELRRQISMIDIYGYTRKIARVKNAKDIRDLNLDEEKANKLLSGELDDIN